MTHTLLPHKIKPVVFDPQSSTNTSQITDHVGKKASNSSQNFMNKPVMHNNVNSVKQ